MITVEQAQAIIDGLPDDVADYISGRGSSYGIDATDLIRKTPRELHDNPEAMEEFMRSRDISHYHATSKGGSRNAINNWMFEDPSTNRSRGNDYMDAEERQEAYQDNATHAAGVNGDFSRLKNGALGGLGLGLGLTLVGPAVAFATSAVGITVAAGAACAYGYKKRGKIKEWLKDIETEPPNVKPKAKPEASEE